jgi:phosphatidylserine/phosphatidylglycerophosphate/cardiolipin synthase-like enzyme
MTDLSLLLSQIQNKETSHVDMAQRTGHGTLQWFLEKDRAIHGIHNHNHLQFLVCGEEGFSAIERDIRAATQSIDLVLWGFDPGMELKRAQARGGGGSGWPRGTTYGDLLSLKAREGVKVRLLLWYSDILINHIGANVNDLPATWLPWSPRNSDVAAPTHEWLTHNDLNMSRLEIRARYCRAWWRAAMRHGFNNLEIRTRAADPTAIEANIDRYLPGHKQDWIEAVFKERGGSHHQKPVLIDYAKKMTPGTELTTCGYVMGLNSVTDYWDTEEHIYNNPRREMNAGSSQFFADKVWYRKPYRDYAIRIQGEALYDLNENFMQGWDSARILSGLLNVPLPAPAPSRANQNLLQPGDIAAPRGIGHRAQVVRTQPERQDASILKAYVLATSNALNYIYVENQYFQLTDWVRLIKTLRQRNAEGMKGARRQPKDISPLHLFVVIPQPENGGMVPRTYETIAQLGAGAGMGAYDKRVQGIRKATLLQQPEKPGPSASNEEIVAYGKRLRAWQAQRTDGELSRDGMILDSVNETPVNSKAELEALGIKALVAMLMTFDVRNEAKDILINQRDNAAQEAQAQQEAQTNTSGRSNDMDSYGTNIVPRRYREIYIHSKLMFVDDVYTTLGSANLNGRSMVGDSELNICTAEYEFTMAARKRVWGNLAGEDLDGGDGSVEAVRLTHKRWMERMVRNKDFRTSAEEVRSPENGSFIHPFEDPRGAPLYRVT